MTDTGIEKATTKGRYEGHEDERQQERDHIARSLRRLGIPPSSIDAATGLTEEELYPTFRF